MAREAPRGRRTAADGASVPLDRRLVLAAIVLVLLVAAVFGRTARNGFVDYDDPAYIADNPHVRDGLSADTVKWAFTTGYKSNWHPLTWLSHALDGSMFGTDPAGHHLVSAALHALNAVLLLLALWRLTGSVRRSAVVAALFAVHPLHVESVAWAAERKDVLSTLFFMLALLVYARDAARPDGPPRWTLAALLALGLMAKPMLVTLPFVLLLLDYWPLRRFASAGPALPPLPLVREKAPLFVLVAASSAVTWAVQSAGGAVATLDRLPFSTRLANAVVAYVTYLVETVWPSGLGVLYPYVDAVPAWKVLGSLAVLAAVTFGVLKGARRAPYLLVGWLWYLGTLVPVIGLVQVGMQSHADRYTYVPLIGIFVMIAWGLTDLLEAWKPGRIVLAAAAVAAVVALAGLAWQQVGFWRSSGTLFERTLAVTRDNHVIRTNYGGTLIREDRLDEAIRHLEEARRIKPDHGPALSNLGLALQGKGRLGEAAALFRDAVRVNPAHLEAWLNLGHVLGLMGDFDGAIEALRQAERLRPDDPAIREAVRTVEERKTRSPAPAEAATSASPEARASYDRGNAARDAGRLAEAEAAYRDAIRVDPGFAEARNNLGSVLGRQGRSAEAVAEVTRALELSPRLLAAHNNLGILLAMQGETMRAEEEFAAALRLQPNDVTAHLNLGVLYARQGRIAEATSHFEEVLRVDPGNASAARALAGLRRG